MDYIKLAKLNKTHGIKGEFKAYCLTDFPSKRLKKGATYFLINEEKEETKEVKLLSYHLNLPFIILKFEGIETVEEAENHLGLFLAIPKEEASLPKDSYFIHDLIGCKVYNEKNEELGVLVDVFSYSPIQNLRVRKEGRKDLQIPFIGEYVKSVDVENKKIVVKLIEGML